MLLQKRNLFLLSILPSTLLFTGCPETEEDIDGDGYSSSEDCNDNDSSIHPSATEICDGIDQNCDNQIDEGVQSTFFLDLDKDGFGDANSSTLACSQPDGYVSDSTDCNDLNANINTSAIEICDEIDQNCDNQIDEGVQNTFFLDLDKDGFGDANSSTLACSQPDGYVSDSTDCDDSNSSVYPNAFELEDGLDNNCNGEIDDISSIEETLDIVGGLYHSLTLKDDGTLWAWGDNTYGQLGDGGYVTKASPIKVKNVADMISVAGGYYHSLALKNDGTVWNWGDNTYGQLGNGSTTKSPIAVQVKDLTNVKFITSGAYHSLAIKNDGTIWAWGINSIGQLGDGNTNTYSTKVVQVKNLNNVISAGCGVNYSIALKDDGTVWSWGSDLNGELGSTATSTFSTTPVQVSDLTGVTKIAGEDAHSLAIKNDGTLWAWGWNLYGQLGDGTVSTRYTPVKVKDLTNVTAIEGGYGHSIALKNDGTVWSWGYNQLGQLGDGTTTTSSPYAKLTPVQTKNLTNVTMIDAGNAHSLAITNDSVLWAWGYNYYGQLGDGTYTNKSEPVKVKDLNGIINNEEGTSLAKEVKDSNSEENFTCKVELIVAK